MSAPFSTLQRKPMRITITIPHGVYDELQQRSDQEGRSVSNLGAYLLELALQDGNAVQRSPIAKRWPGGR